MQRIFLFLVTNIAIMIILSITLRILGVESLLAQNGSDLNVNALVIFSEFWRDAICRRQQIASRQHSKHLQKNIQIKINIKRIIQKTSQ